MLVFCWGYNSSLVLAHCGDCDVAAEHSELEEELDVSPRETLEFLKKHFPRWFDRMMVDKVEYPEGYQDELEGFSWFIQEYQDLKEENPEFAECFLASEINSYVIDELIDEYHEAEGEADRMEVESKLREKVEQSVDLDIKLGEFEVEQLELELDELRRELKEYKTSRSEMISERMEEVLFEDDDDDDEDEEGDD